MRQSIKLWLFYIFYIRYKNEILVDGDPVIFEICDTCPKVGSLQICLAYYMCE